MPAPPSPADAVGRAATAAPAAGDRPSPSAPTRHADGPGGPGPSPHNWHAAATMVLAVVVAVVIVGATLHRNEPAAAGSAGAANAVPGSSTSSGTSGPSAPSGGAPAAVGASPTAAPGSPVTTSVAAWQQQFLACVRQTESRNNYAAVGPTGAAFGAYQMTQTTWNNTVQHYGYTWLYGIQPNEATPAAQDMVAASLLEWQGSSPWTDGC